MELAMPIRVQRDGRSPMFFRMHTCEKCARNPSRMNGYETKDLNHL